MADVPRPSWAPAGVRDYNEIHAEQVAAFAAAVQAATSTADAQTAQAGTWMDGGMDAEGYLVSPGGADPDPLLPDDPPMVA